MLNTESFVTLGTGTGTGDSKLAERVPWWQRWVEAGCIPKRVYYENVDVDHLKQYLLAIPIEGSHGLKFPLSKTAPITSDASRATFVDSFLTGEVLGGDPNRPKFFVTVAAGAFIGHADLKPGATDESRLAALHATYSDHDPAANKHQPMNPRELLYLLFGDTSPAFA